MEQPFVEFDRLIKKLGKDTLNYIPAKLIPGSITVLSVAIFTRIFPPAQYGQYILIFTTTTILSAILSQWIMQATLRYRAEYIMQKKINFFNKNIAIILSLITILVLIVSMLLYPFRSIFGEYHRFYLISVSIIITQIWFDNLITIFQADLKSVTFSIYTILNAVFKFGGALLIIIFIRRDISALLMGIILANIFFSVPLGFQLKDKSNPFHSKENISGSVPASERFNSFSKQFFMYGFPMVGWFLGAQLLNIADRYFLQIFRSSEEVGIYSSNYNLVASAISFVSAPLLTAAHPLLMNLGASISMHKKEAQILITTFSRYFLIISFPILTYVLIFSKELTTIFLGLDYRRGNLILPIVLFGLLGWNFAMFGHKGLEFREKTRTMFAYVMICTAAKIILNFLFIPRYGYMGAAISTLICFYLYPLMVYFGTKSDIRWIIPWVSLTRVLVASAILAAAFMILKMMHLDTINILLMSGIIIFPLYFFALLLLKEIKPYEIEFAKNYLRNNFRRIKGSP